MFDRLQRNMARNGIDASVFNVAAGSSDGSVTITPDPTDRGSSRIADAVEGTLSVPVRRLLNIVLDAGFDHIDLLKIDVEGYEDRVLVPFFRNASPKLWPRALIIEESARSSWAENVVDLLPELGYARAARSRGNAWWILKG